MKRFLLLYFFRFQLLGLFLFLGHQQLYAQGDKNTLTAEEAISCQRMANSLYRTDPIRARAYYEDLGTYYKDAKNWKKYAELLGVIAALEYYQGNYELGEKKSQENVEEISQLIGKENREYLRSLNNLAGFYSRRGKWKAAISKLEEARAISQSTKNRDAYMAS
ncbi:MAG: tetratricopeptide repeat protein, partial [Bacteroidota bacterium]